MRTRSAIERAFPSSAPTESNIYVSPEVASEWDIPYGFLVSVSLENEKGEPERTPPLAVLRPAPHSLSVCASPLLLSQLGIDYTYPKAFPVDIEVGATILNPDDLPTCQEVELVWVSEDVSGKEAEALCLGQSPLFTQAFGALLEGTRVQCGASIAVDWTNSLRSLTVSSCQPAIGVIRFEETRISVLPRHDRRTATGASATFESPNTATESRERAAADGDSQTGRMTQPQYPWKGRIEDSFVGFKGVVDEVRAVFSSRLSNKHDEVHCSTIPSSVCLLLSGISGCGKSALIQSVCKASLLPHTTIQAPDLYQKYVGKSEAMLIDVFKQVRSQAPAILVIEELDALSPQSGDGSSSGPALMEKQLCLLLCRLLDSLLSGDAVSAPVFVLATSNRPEALHPMLCAAGRFDRAIRFPSPRYEDRRELLARYLQVVPIETSMTLSRDSLLSFVAERTGGFSPADLHRVCTELSMAFWRRRDSPRDALSQADVALVVKEVRPSNVIQYRSPTSLLSFQDLGGIQEVIDRIQRSLLTPLQQPEAYLRLGVRPPKGLLLHGPSGTGKTCIALATAHESGMTVLSTSGSQLVSKILGDSEKAITRLFRKARESAPCMVLIDQLETIAPQRGNDRSSEGSFDRLLSTLLTEMDGVGSRTASADDAVVVVATTHDIKLLDSSILRPGRLDLHVKLAMPTVQARQDILRVKVRDVALDDDVDLEAIALASSGLHGAALESVCRDAAMRAFREDHSATCVKQSHFLEAVKSASALWK